MYTLSILTCRQRKLVFLSPSISLEYSAVDEDESSDTFYTQITSRLKPRNLIVGEREVEGICAKTHTALKKKKD